jgi:hypothetical protein
MNYMNIKASNTHDMEEFFQQVNESQKELPENTLTAAKALSSLEDDDSDRPYTGQPAQYSHLASGFTPMSKTLSKLPAGVYSISFANNIPFFDPMRLYTDKILRLSDSKSEEVVAEIEGFWNTPREEFDAEGFLYKTGILMYGPPGSGKTMTIAIIIEEMVKRNGVVLLVDRPVIAAPMLASFRKIEPERPIVVVLEDIDTIVDKYGESDLLSMLDGELQIDNIVFLATTNYPERLDARLVNRPSRFDYIIKVGMPSALARRQYLEHKNKPLLVPSKKNPDDMVDLIAETEGLSIAHMRELVRSIFIRRKDARDTVERLKRMRVLPKSTEGKKIGIGE